MSYHSGRRSFGPTRAGERPKRPAGAGVAWLTGADAEPTEPTPEERRRRKAKRKAARKARRRNRR